MYAKKLLLLWAVLFFTDTVHSDIIRIPLKRTKSPRHILTELHVQDNIPKWFQHIDLTKPKPKPKTNDSIALFKYMDSEFYGEVCIGHPCQKFTVLFDTSWANSWVPSANCPWYDPPCTFRDKYRSDKSSTYVANGTKIYIQTGEKGVGLKGFLSKDQMHIAHLTVQNQTFAEMESLPLFFTFSKADGIIGLAYSSFSIYGVVPVFYNLFKQNKQIKPIFSFYINRDPTTNRGGNIIIGASQKKHYNGSLTYTPVTRKMYWQFRMQQVMMVVSPPHKAELFCLGGCDVFIDSSSSIISGPIREIQRINQLIKANPYPAGRYKVPCNMVQKLPDINFIIEKKNFTLAGRDYVQQIHVAGAVICFSVFVATQLQPPDDKFWSLGTSFMSKYYTEFNMLKNQIGFAAANQ